MPYCTNCGEEITGDQRYCSYCGEPMDGGREKRAGTTGPDSPSAESTPDRGRPVRERTGDRVLPKGAVGTVVDAAGWLFGAPVLIAAFLVVDLLGTTSDFLGPYSGFVFATVALLSNLTVGGVAYIYVDDEFRDGSTSFGAAASAVVDQLLSLVAIFLVYAVAVVIGLALFVLPGIYLGARLVLAFPACVLGRQGAAASLSTGWELAGGNVLKLVGIFLLGVLPIAFVAFLGTGLAGNTILGNPLFLLATAPISAVLTGVFEMATARVYLENRAEPWGGVPWR